ncbi:hypothetical protein Syun_019992 [Stephania yunnanensis]|uniref:Caffeic acid O-methyltransferase n=1 Tax=Stephania yunnanensis TaxID=152371 RepID=A0AAP0IVV1_9MAGN
MLTSITKTNENGQVERMYGLAPVCKYLVSNEDGVSLSPIMFLIQDKALMDSWYHLKDAVLDGGVPFNKAHGVQLFEYPGIDRRFNDVLNIAMFNHTTIIMKKILERYKGFEDVKELVDVGGGIGTTISIITSKYPTIKGINFDLLHVIERAPTLPGVKHVGGDMFIKVPKGEAIFIKHDWSDEYCSKLLRNCYDSLPSDGKLIVVEAILPEAAEKDIAARGLCQIDMVMMTQNQGGKERTDKEFEALATEAGFGGIRKLNEDAAAEEDFLFAMQLAGASVLPMVLQAASELQVLEIIAKAGPGAYLSPKEISSQLPTRNPESPALLDRITRLLTSYSVLTSVLDQTSENGQVERMYGLAPVCRYLVSNEDGVSFSINAFNSKQTIHG